MNKKPGKKRKPSARSNKNQTKQILNIMLRYFILIIAGFSNLWIFYSIFAPLTINLTNFLLSLFFDSSIVGNVITLSNCCPIEIIDACIASSAYYLLLIFNLSTPNILLKKRIKMIVLAFAAFFILNTLRIFLLGVLFVSGSVFFDATHKLFWYIISTIFVVGIWFAEVKIFRIKEIPFYSDLNWIYKKIK